MWKIPYFYHNFYNIRAIERRATTQIEDHKKTFPKCTYFLNFQSQKAEINCLEGVYVL